MSFPDPKVQQYITKRQQSFTDGFNNASVPALMAMFAEDVEFNDYATGVLNLNRASLEKYYAEMVATFRNINIRTKSISGSEHFTAWEWDLTMYELPSEAAAELDNKAKSTTGKEINMVGVSLMWWNSEGKIIKNHDYGKEVPNAE
ncbi:hypothetical protein KAF25_002477 [Fusarium avenaceum]|uniref:SnoaL-like domain-containing protein n=1 Tax=Fusarium avenaceum TaxID=40199 RepID=A0A9P7H1W9_9HYPO|nr:hypothetical protein KAF25_002477 [Fusarium avenaceum]